LIAPLLSLAFTVEANPGVYALLLGSGISRAAAIPTGWEITLDLVRKLAAAAGEPCNPNEAGWFRSKFGAEPDYSVLLRELAKTPAERKQLLQSYFQPNDDDRTNGRKIPTAAHHAIAELVRDGFVRIILTTNFDTLIEDALRSTGLAPYVVRSPSDIAGMPPLSHSRASVVKLHGDYLDTRIRNTPAELEAYPSTQNRLLGRILDEFGLIVCGWSTECDTALRDAIAKSRSRRYSCYWAAYGEPKADAQHLIELRGAHVITIAGANEFFRDLADKVQAIRAIGEPHPISAAVAAEQMRRFLEEPVNRIRLSDLMLRETERAFAALSPDRFPPLNVPLTQPDVQRVLHDYANKYRAAVDVLLSVMAVGAYWGNEATTSYLTRCLQRIACPEGSTGVAQPNLWSSQRYLPATLLLYAGGIAGLANSQYHTVASLLNTTCRDQRGDAGAAAVCLTSNTLPNGKLGQNGAPAYPGLDPSEYRFSLSYFLFKSLRPALAGLLPEEERYSLFFDKFEYLLSLVHEDLHQSRWAPVGRFANLGRPPAYLPLPPSAGVVSLDEEINAQGLDWQGFKVGLFDGSMDRFHQAKQSVDKTIEVMKG
jgi:hypothetical protein